MSRIGKNPVSVPKGVTVEVAGQMVKAKGPKGEQSYKVSDLVSIALEDAEGGAKQLRLAARNEDRQSRTQWPTDRANIKNMIQGVAEGYSKNLEIQGVGYRANLQGQELVMSLGYSHEIRFPIPKGITVTVDKQTKLTVTGNNKNEVGQVAANIQSYRPPEPYKGKGIRYEGQFVLRKEGKKK